MNSLSDAKVNLSESDNKNVHYVFVPEGSQAAVDTWGAKPLAYTTASNMASGVDNGTTVRWYQTKHITYELQDIADILPTHAQTNPWSTHWLSRAYVDVLLESPIINEAGQAETPTGLQRFYVWTRDVGKSDQVGADEAFMYKKAFTGTYSAELNSEFTFNPVPDVTGDDFPAFEGIGVDDYGRTRGAASGYLTSHNSFGGSTTSSPIRALSRAARQTMRGVRGSLAHGTQWPMAGSTDVGCNSLQIVPALSQLQC